MYDFFAEYTLYILIVLAVLVAVTCVALIRSSRRIEKEKAETPSAPRCPFGHDDLEVTIIRCKRRSDESSHDVAKLTCPGCGFTGFSEEDLVEYERYILVLAQGRIE